MGGLGYESELPTQPNGHTSETSIKTLCRHPSLQLVKKQPPGYQGSIPYTYRTYTYNGVVLRHYYDGQKSLVAPSSAEGM